MSEPEAITELRKRVEYAKEMNERSPTFGNHKLGVFLTDLLQAYDDAVDSTGKHHIDRVWEEYHKIKEELADERSKRKQIEELYDNLKADVAPLIKAAKELNESYEDAYVINKVRRAVKYL
jgi:hypothetical protein